MKNIFLKSALLFSVIAGIFTSCVNDDQYDSPEIVFSADLTPTKTVKQINDGATAAVVQYAGDDIIEAYVTSSDEKGNFYKSVSFQTIPTDATAPIGFSVPIDDNTLYGEGFSPGRKVYIKLKGLYVAKVYGSLQIGSLFEGTIGRIPVNVWRNHLFPSATKVSEDSFVRPMTMAAAFTDANQNTLVELDPVQFGEGSLGRTYYDVDSGGGSTNHSVIATTGGASQVIRFSSFAPFSGNMVPSGSGKIRGVITKYQTTFQFMVRYESDINLTGPRADLFAPIGGSALVYTGAFSEPFTSYTTSNQQVFPKYINDAAVGSRYWQVKTFSGNKYIQMSSFGGTPEANRSLFIVPVDMTAANNFSFKTEAGFDNGPCLKVYYSMNYVPGSNINNATLVDITSNFVIPAGPASAYATSFTSSGVYPIPSSLTGNGYFIFEYKGNGNGGVTTTMQIDDITVN
ncbi:DUF5689 domain-containing protein [Flavobacterium humi]|uniref:DUF5689 domain-containing protein n=1 Tax=Flavobacterium humi TaxID=2562683 RepID=A0A4Z0LAR0_9FLAO|nr:DUF5689 domain-containing protein [Flavobacterium humi]TGD58556.1 hypothetical protein E4635_06485 [Flavobacterium humi]